MKNYQLVLVLKNTLEKDARKKFLETLKSWIKDAKFTKEEEWGEKVLAYTIKKQNDGFYMNFLFELEDGLAADFSKKITASDNVLRHLIMRVN